MTIEEAIEHAEEVMMENLEKIKYGNASDPIAIKCFECAEDHRQLAEWLKDYKRLLGAVDAIKTEIQETIDSTPYHYHDYEDGRIDAYEDCLEFIDKHTIRKEK